MRRVLLGFGAFFLLGAWLLWPSRPSGETPALGGADPAQGRTPSSGIPAGAQAPADGPAVVERIAAGSPRSEPGQPAATASLDPSAAVRVLAHDPREQGVSGARVFAHHVREGWRELGRTDERGELWIPWEARGEWLDAVGPRARGGASASALAAGATVRILLTELVEIRGHTVSPLGVGVPNVAVEVSVIGGGAGPDAAVSGPWDDSTSPYDLDLTSADGSFAFWVDPARSYELLAYSVLDGWVQLEPLPVRAGDLDVRIPLLAVYAAQVVVRLTSEALHRDVEAWQLAQGLRVLTEFNEPIWTLARDRPNVRQVLSGEHFRNQRHEFAAELVLATARIADALDGMRVSGELLGHGVFETELTLPRLRMIPHVATIVLPDAALGRTDARLRLDDPGGAGIGAILFLEDEAGATCRRTVQAYEADDGNLLLRHLPAGRLRARLHWPESGASMPAEGSYEWRVPAGGWAEIALDLRALGSLRPILTGPDGLPWTGPVEIRLEPRAAQHARAIHLPALPAPYAIGGLPPGQWSLTVRRHDAAGPLAAVTIEVTTRSGEAVVPRLILP